VNCTAVRVRAGVKLDIDIQHHRCWLKWWDSGCPGRNASRHGSPQNPAKAAGGRPRNASPRRCRWSAQNGRAGTRQPRPTLHKTSTKKSVSLPLVWGEGQDNYANSNNSLDGRLLLSSLWKIVCRLWKKYLVGRTRGNSVLTRAGCL
jgi:hypothetical protein